MEGVVAGRDVSVGGGLEATGDDVVGFLPLEEGGGIVWEGGSEIEGGLPDAVGFLAAIGEDECGVGIAEGEAGD